MNRLLQLAIIFLTPVPLLIAQTSEMKSSAPKKFAVQFGVGASFFELTEVNGRFVNADFYGGSFGSDLHLFFGVAYFIIPNLSFDFNILHLTERLTGEGDRILCEPVSCPGLFSKGMLQTRLFSPSLNIRYHVFSNKFDYFGRMGSALGWVSFKLKTS